MRYITGTGIFGALSLVISQSYFIVPGGHRAVIFDRIFGGVKDDVFDEGIHFMVPIIQTPVYFNVRMAPRPIFTETVTKDLQTIRLGVRVIFRPDCGMLPQLYRRYDTDYARRLLPSFGEGLKSVVAQYDASELITQREVVSDEIKRTLSTRADQFYIILDDIAITDLSFSKEFTSAVERKQIAQQDAERSRFVVEKSEQEKLVSVILAEGEAESARLIHDATEKYGTAFIELKRIEAVIDMAETLKNSPNITYIPSEDMNMLLNLGGNLKN
eukprot:TRINITY_DN4223_c0_g2_i1.p1 TRINITY_DN4223_c0_g2~~TRINITY_DN4223_c0_g2_i1.p1  ORF type:complete len:283 (+),score=65.26 TRINITY_DN4223_c0_g2_i1:34-849(+)